METQNVIAATKIKIPYLEDLAKNQLDHLNGFFGMYLLQSFTLRDLGIGIERDRMDGCNILLLCSPEEESNLEDLFINHAELNQEDMAHTLYKLDDGMYRIRIITWLN
jgi:hypothetical protein